FGLAAGLAGSAAVGLVPGPADAADAYDALRLAAIRLITGGQIDPADADYRRALTALDGKAAAYWQALDRTSGRTTLWPDLALTKTDAVNANQSLNRLLLLATAWA